MRSTAPLGPPVSALLLGLLACQPTEGPAPAEEPTVTLFSVVGFEPIIDGTSRGFDLDGAATSAGEPTGCGRPDFTTPDGVPGVDNAFGPLLPVIASLGGEALQSLVQNSVLSGELLLLVELDDLDATPVGTCTTGRIVRGDGLPFLGTDGQILPFQTFSVHPDFPSAELTCAEPQSDGSLLVDGVELRLPLQVFDETIDLTMTGGRMSLTPTDTGWSGLVGGGVSVDELAANVFGFDAIPEELETGVVAAARLAADLNPDDTGVCQHLSVTLAFDAVPAFLTR